MATSPMSPFAELITIRRKYLGLTQRQLAELAGVGEVFLRQLEHGKTTVRLDRVLAVTLALGLRISAEPVAGLQEPEGIYVGPQRS